MFSFIVREYIYVAFESQFGLSLYEDSRKDYPLLDFDGDASDVLCIETGRLGAVSESTE